MILSKNTRIRYPDAFRMADNAIIDDFCYISAPLKLGSFSHIASNCTIAGGRRAKVDIGDFSCLASGVRLYVATDDFVNDIATALPENLTDVKDHLITGDVTLNNFVTIGANTIIMPNNNIPEGVSVGCNSLIPPNFEFEPWSVYVGFPKLFKLKDRNKDNIIKQYNIIKQRMGL